jgi:hypothetical protein
LANRGLFGDGSIRMMSVVVAQLGRQLGHRESDCLTAGGQELVAPDRTV